MTALDDLFESIFEGRRPGFAPEFEGWVRGSRRFKAFATEYRAKIRTKLKSVRDDAGMKDLRAELETAALLLREERFTLEYEKYAASRQRGPDFTVTFRTHTPFNVEVRRIRGVELDEAGNAADAGTANTSDNRTGKLMTVLCDKVGQMPPGIINLLWLTADRALSEADLNSAAVTLRYLAERKTEDYFTRRGFKSAVDFLRQYQQLSAMVLHQSDENSLWLNSLARHKLPPELANTLRRLEVR